MRNEPNQTTADSPIRSRDNRSIFVVYVKSEIFDMIRLLLLFMEAFCDGNNRYDLIVVVYGREGRNDWCVIWKGVIDGRMEGLVWFLWEWN